MNYLLNTKILGFCPWCGAPIIKAKTRDGRTLYEHEEKKTDCSFVLFQNAYVFGNPVRFTDAQVETLLRGETIALRLVTKAGKPFDAWVSLDPKPRTFRGKQYPRYKFNGYVR